MTLDDERKIYLEAVGKNQLLEWFLNHFCYEMCLEEHIELLNKEKEQRREAYHPHTYYPSKLGYCLRNQQLSSLFPSETAIHSGKTFFYGDMIQDYQADVVIVQWAQRHNLGIVKVERSFTIPILRKSGKPTIYIDGRMDDLLELKDQRGNVAIEVKSQNGYVAGKKSVSSTHLSQICPYMIITRGQFAYVVYIDKQGSPKTDDEPVSKTFRELFSNDCWEQIIIQLEYIDDSITAKKLVYAEAQLPTSNGSKNAHAWECNPAYCPYYKWCHKQPTEETPCDFSQLTKEVVCENGEK